jgi:Arc/MetJ-type ribon-helix-helix transcriptional regulator
MATRANKPGRPPKLRSPTLLTVRLPSKVVKRIDSFARRRKAANRSDAIRYLLDFALDEMAKEDRRG